MRLTAAALMCCAMVFAAQGCSDSQQPHVTGTTPYTITVNGSLPPPVIPSDNPLTQEGVLLGRTLFHDPLLSKNSKQSCADCHRQESSFIDPNRAFSIGVDGL
ncbi:MAG: cytochrome-c peroxidase, partial [Candidatus Kapabacteria bacterium]|nr:cytochrome-c peroxidase [Candidatus Kapabacteria bacterium]